MQFPQLYMQHIDRILVFEISFTKKMMLVVIWDFSLSIHSKLKLSVLEPQTNTTMEKRKENPRHFLDNYKGAEE